MIEDKGVGEDVGTSCTGIDASTLSELPQQHSNCFLVVFNLQFFVVFGRYVGFQELVGEPCKIVGSISNPIVSRPSFLQLQLFAISIDWPQIYLQFTLALVKLVHNLEITLHQNRLIRHIVPMEGSTVSSRLYNTLTVPG